MTCTLAALSGVTVRLLTVRRVTVLRAAAGPTPGTCGCFAEADAARGPRTPTASPDFGRLEPACPSSFDLLAWAAVPSFDSTALDHIPHRTAKGTR